MKSTGVVNRLVSRSMRDNRTRNLAAILAIALTAIMFTTVFTVGMSMMSGASLVGMDFDTTARNLLAGGSVLAMILASGYLIIYNIFNISVTRDIQYYGRLKTLGASDKQIRRMVFSQALRLCAIGTPVGLLAGYGLGAYLIPIVLVSLGADAVLTLHPAIFIGSALFSILTVLLSSAKPASMAGKIPPVAAVKYTDSDAAAQKSKRILFKRNAASTKRSAVQKKQAPITPSRMARNNLKRNKKRTRLVVVSIALGLALMNSFYVYQHSFDEVGYVAAFIQSDIAITGNISPEMRRQVADMPGVEQLSALWYAETEETLNTDVIQRMTTYYDEEYSGQRWWIQDNEDAARQYQGIKQTGASTVSVYGLDAYTAGTGKVFVGEYDEEKFASGDYVIAYGLSENGEGSEHYVVGDIIQIQGRHYELMAMIEPTRVVKEVQHSPQNEIGINYLIHSDRFLESFSNTTAAGLFLETTDNSARDSLVNSLTDMYPDMEVSSRLTYVDRFNSQSLAIAAMGYALGFLMALIGILNFANTMLTAIIARKHEFTMLESIGMAKKQLRKMIVHEGVAYIVFSLALGIVASILIGVFIIEEVIATSWVANYNFTLVPFAVITPILIALAIIIPTVCFRGTQKQSLVERLRSE